MTELEKLEELRLQAMQMAQTHPDAEEVTAVQTSAGNIYFLLDSPLRSHFDKCSEDAFLDKLIERRDTHVLLIVTIWKAQEVDFPIISLRTRLVELDIRNRDALMLVRGTYGRHPRVLHSTLPPTHTEKHSI